MPKDHYGAFSSLGPIQYAGAIIKDSFIASSNIRSHTDARLQSLPITALCPVKCVI